MVSTSGDLLLRLRTSRRDGPFLKNQMWRSCVAHSRMSRHNASVITYTSLLLFCEPEAQVWLPAWYSYGLSLFTLHSAASSVYLHLSCNRDGCPAQNSISLTRSQHHSKQSNDLLPSPWDDFPASPKVWTWYRQISSIFGMEMLHSDVQSILIDHCTLATCPSSYLRFSWSAVKVLLVFDLTAFCCNSFHSYCSFCIFPMKIYSASRIVG